MKILIVGASGLVGSNCQIYFEEKGWEVVGTHLSYPTEKTVFYNPLEPETSEFSIKDFKPNVILHAGALTHVDLCEQEPEKSFELTVQSTKNLAQAAQDAGSLFIYVSTDYIFDGKDGPYFEDAKPNPISVYGRHKYEAEMFARGLEKHLVIRVTNVYGDEERGKNFVARLIKVAKEKEELHLKLPIDQYATPVNAADVAKALFLLIKDGKKGVYNIASTDYLNRIQLANKVLDRFSEHKVSIQSITTEELKQPAPRPLQGGLKSHKFLTEYPEFRFSSVDNYLEQKLK